ncbi:hypothetical protein DIZ76_013685 [Coccidioides immitis]|nr:hypothetical protein DIZ76_013685 [Coccidioides immitis]
MASGDQSLFESIQAELYSRQQELGQLHKEKARLLTYINQVEESKADMERQKIIGEKQTVLSEEKMAKTRRELMHIEEKLEALREAIDLLSEK